jgi:Zn-dependent M28 family amino/carboxypeptidase
MPGLGGRHLRLRLAVVAAGLVVGASAVPAGAQSAAQLKKAAAAIAAADVARHVGVIADDSMLGRNTPSRGLEMTARYVADHFGKFGLTPAGDSGTWFQRYPVKNNGTAPNTVGVLEGSDPKLKEEYVVLTAHMDHIGVGEGRGLADSIHNGADDNGAGTAGIIELAEAFSRRGARPKRSILFVAVSGEEHGMWGSGYFVEHPPVPLKQMVANINFDMIGRGKTDSTVLVIGKEHSDLGATFDRVNGNHPELRLASIPNPPAARLYSSDHYSFARKGVPILKFGGPSHTDYHQVTDSPDKIDAERTVRILRLAFYITQEVANAAERPKWNEESHKMIVEP